MLHVIQTFKILIYLHQVCYKYEIFNVYMTKFYVSFYYGNFEI